MMETFHCSFHIWWSKRDRQYVARSLEFTDLTGLGATQEEALAECRVAVECWLEYLADEGLEPPRSPGALVVVMPSADELGASADDTTDTHTSSTFPAPMDIPDVLQQSVTATP